VSGNTALGPMDNPGSGIDVVAMDDFLYAEPRAVPEAAGLTLVGMGARAPVVAQEICGLIGLFAGWAPEDPRAIP